MLKKSEVIQIDSRHAICQKRTLAKMWPQKEEGNKRAEDSRRQWRGASCPPELASFQRAFLQQIWCGFLISATQGPRDLIFTACINHITWIIAEHCVHRPRSLGHLIHEINRAHNSANKITGVRRKCSINLSLWILHLGFDLHPIEQLCSDAGACPLGLCAEKMGSQRINVAY